MTLLIPTHRCQWHCWFRLPSVSDTADSDSPVSVTLLIPPPRFQWHCWFRLPGVSDTADSDSPVSVTFTALSFKWHRRVKADFVHDLRYSFYRDNHTWTTKKLTFNILVIQGFVSKIVFRQQKSPLFAPPPPHNLYSRVKLGFYPCSLSRHSPIEKLSVELNRNPTGELNYLLTLLENFMLSSTATLMASWTITHC